MKTFPEFHVRCVGHTKGQPEDNNDSKMTLSRERATAVKMALLGEGVENDILVVGQGCSQGLGMCVKLHTFHPSQVVDEPPMEQPKDEDDVDIPDASGMSVEEREATLNELFDVIAAKYKPIAFTPNSADIPDSGYGKIRATARVMKTFPEFHVRCEGHSKGKPEDNNDSKMTLSRERATAVKMALLGEGVENDILVVGQGCSQGLGMCVKLHTFHPSQVVDEPPMEQPKDDDVEIPDTGYGKIRATARVMKTFPEFHVRCVGHTKGQ